MSFLRALRAYIGLAPDEEIEGRYLYELDARRRELDLREHEREGRRAGSDGGRARRHDHGSGREPDVEYGYDDPEDDGVGRWEVDFGDADGAADHECLNPEDYDDLVSGSDAADVSVGGAEDNRMVTVVNSRSGNADRNGRSGRLGRTGRGAGRGKADDGVDDGFRVVDQQVDDQTDEVDLRLGPIDGPDRTGADSFAEYIPATGAAADDETEAGETNRGAAADKGSQEAVVRSLDSMRAKPRTLIPDSFGDAKVVADEFKRGIPVVLNLQSLERELARRLIDFASGLCYALDGSMEKIASQVFLLTPEEVEVSDEDRRRIEERGYAR